MTMTETKRWPNPWETDLVYVPIEELAEALSHDGFIREPDGSDVIMTAEWYLNHWATYGSNLDAYILEPRGVGVDRVISVGVRYGEEGSHYLSPYARNTEATRELFNRYRGDKFKESKTPEPETLLTVSSHQREALRLIDSYTDSLARAGMYSNKSLQIAAQHLELAINYDPERIEINQAFIKFLREQATDE